MTSGSHWLIRSSNPKSQLQNLDLRLDSQVFVISQEDDTVTLDEVYRTGKDMPMMVNSVGVWSPMSRLVMTKLSFWERRKNLGGAFEFAVAFLEVGRYFRLFFYNPTQVINASFYQDPPSIYASYPNGANGPVEVSGFIYDIWHHFELSSNFRYHH